MARVRVRVKETTRIEYTKIFSVALRGEFGQCMGDSTICDSVGMGKV